MPAIVWLFLMDQMDVIKKNLESRIKAFQQELEKFAARWNQLKPSDDLIEGDKLACTKALRSLKDRRAEFDELLQMVGQLRWVDGWSSNVTLVVIRAQCI